MIKFVFTGPESTGKTYLADQCSKIFGLPLVEEKAREYLDKIDRRYNYKDLEVIAKLQLLEEWKQPTHKNIICDTDILTLIVWAKDKFLQIPPWFLDVYASQKDGYYLLCQPDIPWQADPQRENPNDRDRLFHIYLDYLKNNDKKYSVISGDYSQRLSQSKNIIQSELF